MAADWRRAEHYAGLERCGRHAFAWEWLRRSAAYCDACRAAQGGAGYNDARRFGLHGFEPADRPTPAARPIWRADTDGAVLTARVADRLDSADDRFDLSRLRALATCQHGDDGEHWLFSDGWRQVRLDLTAGSLIGGPVRLDYQLSGLASALPHAIALTRLIALSRTGRLNATLFPRERRARRWILALRAHDALAAGASQRDIAETLLGLDRRDNWRVAAPGYRRKAQRLVETVRWMATKDAGFWLRCGFNPTRDGSA
ncbi:DNA -binding domain-containing protein [Sphingobium fuliginis]|uniref:DUF2285 domain-containing protein n=1 Tax=Sphingobium fuliginis ATCC 27551 TaxID=1208342 RepID=A0A5B8CED1_SPHSA|nr:DUF2285 domain-containing protein [Sphingobium fuliginis]QDC37235.1 DUF2285 domain-containing protein [Sphingobium fuliginis ATCC 27551]